jgi:hypothetical protein
LIKIDNTKLKLNKEIDFLQIERSLEENIQFDELSKTIISFDLFYSEHLLIATNEIIKKLSLETNMDFDDIEYSKIIWNNLYLKILDFKTNEIIFTIKYVKFLNAATSISNVEKIKDEESECDLKNTKAYDKIIKNIIEICKIYSNNKFNINLALDIPKNLEYIKKKL